MRKMQTLPDMKWFHPWPYTLHFNVKVLCSTRTTWGNFVSVTATQDQSCITLVGHI
jgi:hypothetical protein